MAAYPNTVASVRANRAFLARSVRYLAAEAGIRQFLDIGTGGGPVPVRHVGRGRAEGLAARRKASGPDRALVSGRS